MRVVCPWVGGVQGGDWDFTTKYCCWRSRSVDTSKRVGVYGVGMLLGTSVDEICMLSAMMREMASRLKLRNRLGKQRGSLLRTR